MGFLSRTVDEAIEFAEKQAVAPTQSWKNLCQSFCRQAYGVPAWAASAKQAWEKIPKDQKRSGGYPDEAPRGALIYFTSGEYGHVALAIGKSTSDKCWSNDYVESGMIDKAPRTFPRWGLTYAGWSAWTPYGEMNLSPSKPMWDGQVPSLDGVFNAMNHGHANPQAYRLACRLYDLGLYEGKPKPEGQQRFPVKAVGNWQTAHAFATSPSGAYSPEMHRLVFPG